MLLPAVCVVTNAQKTNLNLVFAAMGEGPNTFTRKLCAINPAATHLTVPTHWLMSYANATDTQVGIWQAMTEGNLPPLPDGTVWGEEGIISAAAAMAASDGSVFHLYSAAGDIEPVDHVAAVLATEGLQLVPEQEA